MTMDNSVFDNELLETLLNMEEGSTLDFKQEQYPFEKATDDDKGELLKDILAFANTHRYRTAYILVGVKEVKGGKNIIVGVEGHLDDASLHQFVSFKTNRPAEFSYTPFQVDNKEIGVLSIPIQIRPVYSLKNYGKVGANTVYVRDGSSTGIANPDEIADMGRSQTPKFLEWFIRRLRNTAMYAVMVTAQQWFDHPGRQGGYDLRERPEDYKESRDVILRLTESRPLEPAAFSKGIDSYDSLRWVFRTFEELADQCTQVIRTTGSSLIEFGALARAILEIEDRVNFERKVWDEFRIRMKDEGDVLPNPANYNIFSLAHQAVRFVEVVEDEEHYRDPNHGAFSPYLQRVFLRSDEWGEWRR